MQSSSPPTSSRTSYDQVPYPSSAFAQTHPNRLAGLAGLFGLLAKKPSGARVLELACADGGNLLAIATYLPNAHFTGLDASGTHIQSARSSLETAGLKNIEFIHQDLCDFPLTGEPFDYIIAHGLFSWVPDAVRERIFALCNARLAPNGIAYLSYNTLPGWNTRRSLRDMMRFHTQGTKDPTQRVQQGRALIRFLAASVSAEGNAYGQMLQEELRQIEDKPVHYLFHDHLADENTAFYFHEFMARAQAHGLQYLGEAHLSAMNPENFPQPVRQALGKLENIVAQEQYMDFLRNRLFRQTLLCRADIPLQRNISPDRIKQLSFQSSLQADGKAIDWAPDATFTFRGPNGQSLTTKNTLLKAAVAVLMANQGRAMPFTELLDAAQNAIPAEMAQTSDSVGVRDDDLLAASLLGLCGRGMLDVFAEPVPAGAPMGAQPKTSALTRSQAQRGAAVTNRLQHNLPVDAFGRAVILACDGTRTPEQIVQHVVTQATSGRLVVRQGTGAMTDPHRLEKVLRPRVHALLTVIDRAGLFVG